MARRKGMTAAPRQVAGRDFAQQSEAKSNFALSATRAMSGKAGNTGEGALAGVYRRKKAVMGGSLNFARRKRSKGSLSALGQRQAPRDAAQRPFVSTRQYASPAFAVQTVQR